MWSDSDITEESILNIYNFESIFIFPYPNPSLYSFSDYEKLTRGYKLKYYIEGEEAKTYGRNNGKSSMIHSFSLLGPLGWWGLAASPLGVGHLSESQYSTSLNIRQDVVDTMDNKSERNLVIIDRPFNDLMNFKSKVCDKILKNCTYYEKKMSITPRDYRESVIKENLSKLGRIKYVYIYDDFDCIKFYVEIFAKINESNPNKIVPVFVPVSKIEYSFPVDVEIKIVKSFLQEFNEKMTAEVRDFKPTVLKKNIFATGFMLSRDSMDKLINYFSFIKSHMINKLNEDKSKLCNNRTFKEKVNITNDLMLVAPYRLGKRFEQLGGEGKSIIFKIVSYYWSQEHDFLIIKFKPYGDSYERVKQFLKNDREKMLNLMLFCNTTHANFEKLFRSANTMSESLEWVKSASNFTVTAYATQRWVLSFGKGEPVSNYNDNTNFNNAIGLDPCSATEFTIQTNRKKKKRSKKKKLLEHDECDDSPDKRLKADATPSYTEEISADCVYNFDLNSTEEMHKLRSLPAKPKRNKQEELQTLKHMTERYKNIDTSHDIHLDY